VARWESLGRLPASGDGNGFATRFADDFALLGGYGLTHHRLTLEWAALEPLDGLHDPAAVEHYTEVLTAARHAGVQVWAGVHQRCSPGWFADDLGGFVDERARTYHWARHLDWLGETFGSLVFGWTGIHQITNTAHDGWWAGTMPPGRSAVASFTEAAEALLLAEGEVWRRLGGAGPLVATVMNLSPLVAVAGGVGASDDEVGDGARWAARSYDDVMWGAWTRVLTDGVLDLPGRHGHRLDDLVGAFDLVGFSYYSGIGVRADGTTVAHPPGLPTDDYDRSLWPEGMGVTLRRLAELVPGRPLLVAEVGVATHDDAVRSAVLDATLGQIADAMADGVDVRGVLHATGIDAWEWTRGFDIEFGLFDRHRNPRPSAELARRWAAGPPGAMPRNA
jgi:beta-glucosidase